MCTSLPPFDVTSDCSQPYQSQLNQQMYSCRCMNTSHYYHTHLHVIQTTVYTNKQRVQHGYIHNLQLVITFHTATAPAAGKSILVRREVRDY